jgi:hypothetical protein
MVEQSLLLKRVNVRHFDRFTFGRPPSRLHPVARLHPAPPLTVSPNHTGPRRHTSFVRPAAAYPVDLPGSVCPAGGSCGVEVIKRSAVQRGGSCPPAAVGIERAVGRGQSSEAKMWRTPAAWSGRLVGRARRRWESPCATRYDKNPPGGPAATGSAPAPPSAGRVPAAPLLWSSSPPELYSESRPDPVMAAPPAPPRLLGARASPLSRRTPPAPSVPATGPYIGSGGGTPGAAAGLFALDCSDGVELQAVDARQPPPPDLPTRSLPSPRKAAGLISMVWKPLISHCSPSQLFILTDPDPRGHRHVGEAADAGKDVEWKKAASLARSADQMV